MMFKRIVALLAVILFVGLAITTLVIAIFFTDENNSGYFYASLYSMIFIPVLAWAMIYIHGVLNKATDYEIKANSVSDADTEESKSEK